MVRLISEPDLDVLALRGEYVINALEGAHSQAQGVVRFLMLGDYEHALAAWDRMLVFVRHAVPEVKELRAATLGDPVAPNGGELQVAEARKVDR